MIKSKVKKYIQEMYILWIMIECWKDEQATLRDELCARTERNQGLAWHQIPFDGSLFLEKDRDLRMRYRSILQKSLGLGFWRIPSERAVQLEIILLRTMFGIPKPKGIILPVVQEP